MAQRHAWWTTYRVQPLLTTNRSRRRVEFEPPDKADVATSNEKEDAENPPGRSLDTKVIRWWRYRSAINHAEYEAYPNNGTTIRRRSGKSSVSLNLDLNQVSKCTNETIEYESWANSVVTNVQDDYISLLRQTENYTWEFDKSRKLHKDTRGDRTNPLELFRNVSVRLCEELKVIPYENFTNTRLKRQLKLLSDLQIEGLDDDDYHRAKSILKTIANLAKSEKVCSYRNPNNCSFSYLPHINDCIIRTKTPSEMEYYWIEWRNAIKDQSRGLFQEYAELYRKAAALNGHITPSRTWYLYFDDEDFLSEITMVMEDLKPLYAQFHAYIRYQLREKYDVKFSSDDPIPEHLVEQVLLHSWRQHSVIDVPYPDKHLPNVKESMMRLKYNALKVILVAEEFFRSLGFNELSSLFWSDYIQVIPEGADEYDCKAKVYDLYPEIGLRYCTKMDFRKLMQMHGTMTTVFYDLQKHSLPIGLNREAFPGFGGIIGESIILSASTPRHLESIGLIENYSIDKELTLNRLFRLGTHTLLSIPMYFSYEKFWVDALDYRIKPEDYNCAYWSIRQEFAGVDPPEYRSEQTLDPGYRFYSGLDNARSSTTKLLSELMGYQIYRGICQKTGQYVPNDPNYPLHNCDFYQQREAGDILKKIMSSGSTTPWRELLEMATGEKKLSVQPVLEFYEPLHEWLKDFNAKNDIYVGWDTDEKCGKDE